MINVCLENSDECESFETINECINFLENLKEVNVGDKVKVIDTGCCYSNLSNNDLNDLYDKISSDHNTTLRIIFDIDKKCLGYTKGVLKITDTIFQVVAKFSHNSKLIIKPLNDFFKYDGYYIIGTEGVEKCQEI